METEQIFKSYQRKLLRDFMDIKESLQKKDYEVAEELINNLIVDTQKDLED